MLKAAKILYLIYPLFYLIFMGILLLVKHDYIHDYFLLPGMAFCFAAVICPLLAFSIYLRHEIKNDKYLAQLNEQKKMLSSADNHHHKKSL